MNPVRKIGALGLVFRNLFRSVPLRRIGHLHIAFPIGPKCLLSHWALVSYNYETWDGRVDAGQSWCALHVAEDDGMCAEVYSAIALRYAFTYR